MGIGPPGIKLEDIVVILYGGYTPFVLRTNGDKCRFVGECYVHGVMQGEAVRVHRVANSEDVVFRIR